MKWYEKTEILDHIITCYAGVDGKKRQFIWEQVNGDVVIGNARAFADHLIEKFDLHKTTTKWADLHEALRQLGEIVRPYGPRVRLRGGKFKNQEPEIRIIKRAEE